MPSRSRTRAAVVASLVVVVACTPDARSPGAAARPGVAEGVRLLAGDGAALVAACTPTGVELCFNAVDDNCNGVLDEGCGLPTGPVQLVVAWGDSPADVDLALLTSDGERVDTQNRLSASGFHLGSDCPSDGCSGQNFENLYFDGADPPRGRYTVEVRLKKLHGAPSPVRVRFGARLGSRTFGAAIELEPSEAREARTFVIDI